MATKPLLSFTGSTDEIPDDHWDLLPDWATSENAEKLTICMAAINATLNEEIKTFLQANRTIYHNSLTLLDALLDRYFNGPLTGATATFFHHGDPEDAFTNGIWVTGDFGANIASFKQALHTLLVR